ncbi:MAG: hypothetical protein WC799_25550 [Desulfobacteraceae bacterium]
MKPRSRKLKAIPPVYRINKKNQIIYLGVHLANISIDSEVDEVDLHAYIKTEPTLELEFEFDTQISWSSLFEVFNRKKTIAVTIPDKKIDSSMILVSMQPGLGGTRVKLIPARQSVEVGSLGRAVEIRFHLVNFSDFISKDAVIINTKGGGFARREAIILEHNGYEVVIIETIDTKLTMELLKQRGGRAITHTGSIRKLDDSLLTSNEAIELLFILSQFLSFSMVSWTSPILPVAYDASRVRVWESWGIRKINSWKRHQSWLDDHHAETLTSVFKGFAELWNDATWSETLKASVYWYVFSNMRVANVDGSIILAQAALERIAWVYLTEHIKTHSKTTAKKLKTAQKVTEVLNDCKIPVTLPSNYTRLAAYAAEFEYADGPQTITSIRNNLVHPVNKAKGSGVIMDGVYHEALNLYMWYIELVLLNLMGFSGSYSSRITSNMVGQVEKVPWTSASLGP